MRGPERAWEAPRAVWIVIEWTDHSAVRVCGVYVEQEHAEVERRVEPVRRRVIESALLDLAVTAS